MAHSLHNSSYFDLIRHSSKKLRKDTLVPALEQTPISSQ